MRNGRLLKRIVALEERPALVVGGRAAMGDGPVDRFGALAQTRTVGRDQERPPVGKDEAVARFEADRAVDAFRARVASAEHNRVAFHPFVPFEAHRPVPARIKPRRHAVVRMQKRNGVRLRVEPVRR